MRAGSPFVTRPDKRTQRRSSAASSRTADLPLRIAPLPDLPKGLTIAAAALGAVALLVYTLTLYRTVPGGDSGELILAAQNLAVAHPPGYPLFILLGHLASLVPLGEICTRINFVSALCDACAAMLLVLAVGRIARDLGAALLSGALFAFAPLVWRYAVAAEVFALNNLFVAALLYLLVRIFQSEPSAQLRIACIGAFVIGLGLSNHHTFLFFAAPSVLWIAIALRAELLRPRPVALLVALFLLGLLPYALLPLFSAPAPLPGWGDLTTLDGFLTHILRREYGTFQLAVDEGAPADNFWPSLWQFASGTPRLLLFAGLPLALIGAWRTLVDSRLRPRGGLLIAIVALYVTVFCALANLPLSMPLKAGIQERFWQAPDLLLCAWAGLGFSWACARLPRQRAEISLATALGAALLNIGLGYKGEDRSRADVLRRFAHVVLEPLPPHALLLSSGDHVTNTLLYAQENEGLRRDVQIVDMLALTRPWYRRLVEKHEPGVVLPGQRLDASGATGTYNFKEFLDANRSAPLFVVNNFRLHDNSYASGYVAWPQGFVEQLLPRGEELSYETWLARERAQVDAIEPSSLTSFPLDSWEREVLRQYWIEKESFAAALVNYAHAHEEKRAPIDLAISTMEEIEQETPYPDPQVAKNLGAAYQQLMRFDAAAGKEGMVRAWTLYLAQPMPNDVDVEPIRGMIAKP